MGSIRIDTRDRVRVITANGCMAHIRDNPREGQVIEIEMKRLYGGGSEKYRYAHIRLDNGSIIEKPAEPRFWLMHEGLPEYQE
ncbi:MAG: hypothetical protein Q7S43_02040 [bacterium]|nr:hypothetical protein [bacterium]